MAGKTEELAGQQVSSGPVAGGQATPPQGGPEGSPGGNGAQQPEPGTSQPAEALVAGGSLEGAGSAPLPGLPEGMTLEQYVEQKVAKVRTEYEGPDGHLSKLRASLTKQIQEAKRAQNVDAQRTMEAALQMAEKDPQRAIEMLAGTVQVYQERDQQSVFEAEMADWVGRVARELDLDPGDEAVAKVVGEVGPLTRPGADSEVLGQLTKLSNARAVARAESAEKKLAEFEKSLETRVDQLVATSLLQRGAKTVDASEVTRPPSKEDNPIAEINNPAALLRMGYERAVKKKKGGG